MDLLSRNGILGLLFQLRGNPTLLCYYGISVIHSQPFPTIQTVGLGPTSETTVYIRVPQSVKYGLTRKWFSWFVCKHRLIGGSLFCNVCFQATTPSFTLIPPCEHHRLCIIWPLKHTQVQHTSTDWKKMREITLESEAMGFKIHQTPRFVKSSWINI